MDATVRPLDCYRMPWNLNDNILAWLEPTKRCNLYCEGCYSRNEKNSDKTLEQIRADLDVFVKNRRVDTISIAGGDPLVHPQIVEIVRIISTEYKLKPILNTNGLALTEALLSDLKWAGLFGFTFHVDSSQSRPGWKGADELRLNDLRLELAEWAAAAGLSVNFNATVFPDTLQHVPALVAWAGQHIDVVHNFVFILFRTLRSQQFDYQACGKPVPAPSELVYYDEDKNPRPLDAHDMVAKIREADPLYQPAAYLGGTRDPESFKWLIAGRVGDKRGIHGYVGPRFMEAVQLGHHLVAGRYLAYSAPEALGLGLPLMAAGSLFDGGLRKSAKQFLGSVRESPGRLLERQHFQALTIIQPIDMMKDGEQNMCDGCPDMTVHEGKLVMSCRLDEVKQYGCYLTAAPRAS